MDIELDDLSKSDKMTASDDKKIAQEAPRDKNDEKTSISTELTLRQCMLSSENILQGLWISINNLRFTMFLGSLNSWLNDVTGGDGDEGKLSDPTY